MVIQTMFVDQYNLAYMILLLLGMGLLLPYNSFITAADYFSFVFPTHKVEFVFPAVYTISLFMTVIVMLRFGNGSFAKRIKIGFGMFFISTIAIPLIDAFLGVSDDAVPTDSNNASEFMFYATLIAIAFTGAGDAIVQSSLYGMAGIFPAQYVQAVQSGNGVAGVTVSFLRIFTKISYPPTHDGLRKSSLLYFISSSIIIIICIVAFFVLLKLPFSRYYLEGRMNQSSASSRESMEGMQQVSTDDTMEDLLPEDEVSGPVTLQGIWKKIWKSAINVVVVFSVTLLCFPGFVTDVPSNIPDDWFPIILITIFNIFDFVGKTIPNVHKSTLNRLNERVLHIGAAARVVLLPLFIMCTRFPSMQHPAIPVVLTAILGLTGGYFGSLMMMLAPSQVASYEREAAGFFMAFCLIFGLTLGAGSSLLIEIIFRL